MTLETFFAVQTGRIKPKEGAHAHGRTASHTEVDEMAGNEMRRGGPKFYLGTLADNQEGDPMARKGRLGRAGLVERLTKTIDLLDDVKAQGPSLVLLAKVQFDLRGVRDIIDPETEYFDPEGMLDSKGQVQ